MYFRAMTPHVDGLPMRGRSARTLGVRVPQDVNPDAAGYVNPGTGGLSVAPDSMWHVPNHRRPRGMGHGSTGPVQDHVFSIAPVALRDNRLVARRDPVAPIVHALIEPQQRVRLEEFERSLDATRPWWQQAWP
ncbi:MAG: hypothetical protein A2050_05905 [Candidatus Rokubacteria bacterium GWA2_73_35]|nr:MAG: hypothetical protein A2050_05905 [Candidatus Rokubacteria bacterium GWA2_73_35]